MSDRRVSQVLNFAAPFVVASAAALATWPLTASADLKDTVAFDIAAQQLPSALNRYSEQAGVQVTSRGELIEGKTSTGVNGKLAARDALDMLLKDTELRYDVIDEKTVVIVPVKVRAADAGNFGSHGSRAGEEEASSLLRLAQNEQQKRVAQAGGKDASDGEQEAAAKEEGEKVEGVQLEEVVVTGTHIRGAYPVAPLIRVTHDEIVAQGYSRLDQFIQQLPQNFSGGGASQRSNPIPGGGGGEGAHNYAFASGINLRGLGSNATLVLLDGHRLPQTAEGTSVDISRIPLSAIDRVEILTDGASAMYGADAVAGVANIVTKTHFDGFEAGARMDSAASGKTPNFGGNASGGHDWGSGNLLLSFDYEKDNPLLAKERSFASDLAAFSMLLPKIETSSGYASIHQRLSSALTFSASTLASRRTYSAVYDNFGVATRNFGGGNQFDIDAELGYALTATWKSTLSGGFARASDEDNLTSPGDQINRGLRYRTESLEGQIDGPLFTLPAGEAQSAFGAAVRKETYRDRGGSLAIDGRRRAQSIYGELLLPIIAADAHIPLVTDLRVSVSGRHDHYDDFGDTSNPKVAIAWAPLTDLLVRASYGTSFRAPTLAQLDPNATQTGYVYDFPDPTSPTGVRRSLFLENSGNHDLKPERSRSINLSLRYSPVTAPGLSIEASYFDIRFSDKVIRLSDHGLLSVLIDAPQYAGFLNLNPTLAEVNEALAIPNLDIIDFNVLTGGTAFTPSEIKAVASLGYVNAASVHPKGLDLLARQSWDTRVGSFRAEATGSYFLSYDSKFTPAATALAGISRVGEPTRFRAKFELGWHIAAWTTYARFNYAGAYRNQLDTTCGGSLGCSVASDDAIDFGIAYTPFTAPSPNGADDRRLLIALDIANLFDTKPPFVSILDAHYDGANASPIGRSVAVKIARKW